MKMGGSSIDICVGSEQPLHDVEVASLGSCLKCRPAMRMGGSSIDICVGSEQPLHDGKVASLGSRLQRRPATILRSGSIDICIRGKQPLHDIEVTPLSSCLNCRKQQHLSARMTSPSKNILGSYKLATRTRKISRRKICLI